MRFSFSARENVNHITSIREMFDRATIYVAFNLDLRARRRKSTDKCSFASVEKIIVFRAVVPGMYTSRRADEHRRGKSSQTPSPLSSSRTRMRRGEVRRR